MNRLRMLTFSAAFFGALLPVIALAHATPEPRGKQVETGPAPASAQVSRGERVFKQNCSRCHNAPQGFPPQISGTIVRHMRVRASLSAADEKALLEFMNP